MDFDFKAFITFSPVPYNVLYKLSTIAHPDAQEKAAMENVSKKYQEVFEILTHKQIRDIIRHFLQY